LTLTTSFKAERKRTLRAVDVSPLRPATQLTLAVNLLIRSSFFILLSTHMEDITGVASELYLVGKTTH
jgi:hypothetical protein